MSMCVASWPWAFWPLASWPWVSWPAGHWPPGHGSLGLLVIGLLAIGLLAFWPPGLLAIGLLAIRFQSPHGEGHGFMCVLVVPDDASITWPFQPPNLACWPTCVSWWFQIMLLAPGLFSHLSWPVGHDAALIKASAALSKTLGFHAHWPSRAIPVSVQ